MTRLIPALVLMICIAACSKDGGSSSPLVGRWKQTESYDGRTTGGCLCWSPVNEIGGYKYEFKSNGSYTSTPPMYSAVAVCNGNWRVVNDSTLAMTRCGTSTETLHWFKKEGNTLTIAFEIPNFNYKLKLKKVREF